MSQTFLASSPHVFLATTALLAASVDWPRRWLLSGAPILTYSWLLGAANGYRVLPFVSLWTLVATLNLLYAVAATSWLLYWVFFAGCVPAIFASCLFQFQPVADVARRLLRTILKQLHFIDDKVAFFDLPALEIDTEVDGLMVVRGISIFLSTFTIVAHGIEVGIKLSDDMEVAFQANDVTISLLRKISIGNVYCNVKGGAYEMTFGTMPGKSEDENGQPLILVDTPILGFAGNGGSRNQNYEKANLTDELTNNMAPTPQSPTNVLKLAKPLYLVDQRASDKYHENLRRIEESSAINQCRRKVVKALQKVQARPEQTMRKEALAAVCSQLHTTPSVPHPPRRSIRVTSLQNLAPRYIRTFLHRLPMLYRLMLNPISYFHPVSISSITASASGAWVQALLNNKIFQEEPEGSTDTQSLQKKIALWLDNANFTVCLNGISAWAHVPFLSGFDIVNRLIVDDVVVHRTLAKEIDLKQVMHLGGADANIEVPSFLLPHHEHLFPPRPTNEIEKDQEGVIMEAKGKPKKIQAQTELEQIRKDETNMKISVHARLPVVLDEELLGFTMALVKASKIVEMEKSPSVLSDEVHTLREFSSAVRTSIKGSMGKTAIETMVNDKWIAKIIGKVMKRLETTQGDIGYSGNVPISLKPYRDNAESASKILA